MPRRLRGRAHRRRSPDNAQLSATGHAPDDPAPRVDDDPGPSRPARAAATGPSPPRRAAPGPSWALEVLSSVSPLDVAPHVGGSDAFRIRRSRAKWGTSGSFTEEDRTRPEPERQQIGAVAVGRSPRGEGHGGSPWRPPDRPNERIVIEGRASSACASHRPRIGTVSRSRCQML